MQKISLDKYPVGVYTNNTPTGYREVLAVEEKKKERSDEERTRLIHRLNRIEGQIRGIRGMLERSAYCTDILAHVAAANAALNAFSKELLAEHIRTCVAHDIREGRDETIEELVTILQKLMK